MYIYGFGQPLSWGTSTQQSKPLLRDTMWTVPLIAAQDIFNVHHIHIWSTSSERKNTSSRTQRSTNHKPPFPTSIRRNQEPLRTLASPLDGGQGLIRAGPTPPPHVTHSLATPGA